MSRQERRPRGGTSELEPSKKIVADPNGGGSRGRRVESPGEIPTPGWKDIAWRVYRGFQGDRVMLVSAGVTYYVLLALFPAIAMVVSLFGLFANPMPVGEHLNALAGVLPGGALDVIDDQIKRIASQGSGTLGFASIVTLLVSLWSANAGTKSLFDALNIIYKEEEDRGFVRLTLHSLAFTIAGIAFVLVGFVAVVVTPVLFGIFGIGTASAGWLISLIRWPALLVAVLFVLASLYRYGPSRTQPKWRWVTWGSVAAGVIWLIGSILFSWYVANFAAYNKTYGSLGALVGAMVWMWLSIVVILLGAEINAEMEHQTGRDSMEGGEKPMGRRGARMADTVGPTYH